MNTIGKLRRAGFLVVAAGAGAALVAACGSSPAPSTSGAAPTVTKTVTVTPVSAQQPSPQPSATPSGPGACLASDLQASTTDFQGAAGTFYTLLVLTNTSSTACTLYGYPGVSYVTAPGGSIIGAPAGRNPLLADTLVSLQPGQSASALLGRADTGAYTVGCQPTAQAQWLQVYPPGDLGAVYAQWPATVCTDPATVYMHVTAVRAGTSDNNW